MWELRPTYRTQPVSRQYRALIEPISPYGSEQRAQILHQKYAQLVEQQGGDLTAELSGPYASLLLTLPVRLQPEDVIDPREGLNFQALRKSDPPASTVGGVGKATQAPIPWYAEISGWNGFSSQDWAEKLLVEHQQNAYDHGAELSVQSPRDGAGDTRLVLMAPEGMHPRQLVPEDQFIRWHMADQPKDWITEGEERTKEHKRRLEARETGV